MNYKELKEKKRQEDLKNSTREMQLEAGTLYDINKHLM